MKHVPHRSAGTVESRAEEARLLHVAVTRASDELVITRAERRRGYARQIMRALLNEGTARRLAGYWLLVTATNQGAQQLYAGAGFSEAGRYLYRQDRPKRHLTGC